MTGRRLSAAHLRDRLSERDMAVLGSLDQLRLATGDQIRRLYVADGSALTQARRTRALLQRLSELGAVVRMDRSVGGIRAGSQGYVYGIAGLGQAVLTLDAPAARRHRRTWETSPAHQNHVLAITELYVSLVEVARGGLIELLDFQPEPICWRTFSGHAGEPVTLKPDAFIRLGVGDVERSAFVEVDLSTESRTVIARKARTYASYWQTGLEAQRHGVFPEVLWLVPDERRQTRMREVLGRLPANAQELFAVERRADALPYLSTLPAAWTEAAR
ncbi:replication-relaxation family protein [Parafrankia sp. FMc6]|uniref:replication-relaxation family protein n=1 Tax=Parafrankia soli TaxID=2599596 RepID=UPI0034D730B9